MTAAPYWTPVPDGSGWKCGPLRLRIRSYRAMSGTGKGGVSYHGPPVYYPEINPTYALTAGWTGERTEDRDEAVREGKAMLLEKAMQLKRKQQEDAKERAAWQQRRDYNLIAEALATIFNGPRPPEDIKGFDR
jgi:hypothetical protein